MTELAAAALVPSLFLDRLQVADSPLTGGGAFLRCENDRADEAAEVAGPVPSGRC